jgi:cell wall-associated NlpC family hydrolase
VNTVSYTDIATVTRSLGSVVILLVAIISGACAARGGVPRPFPVATSSPEAPLPGQPAQPTPESQNGAPLPAAEAPPAAPAEPESPNEVIQTALTFIGTPYRNGGSDPSGFDCSGFVQYVFAQHGTPLPREVRTQYQHGQTIDLDDVKPGDLVFFETVSRGASHVGIAVGNGRFVHAPSSRGVVRVEPYTASYWARRFVGARRFGETTPALAQGVFPGTIRSSR